MAEYIVSDDGSVWAPTQTVTTSTDRDGWFGFTLTLTISLVTFDTFRIGRHTFRFIGPPEEHDRWRRWLSRCAAAWRVRTTIRGEA